MSINSIHKRYEDATKTAANNASSYQQELDCQQNAENISVCENGVWLNLCVDTASHTIVKVAYLYDGDCECINGMMSAFCEILIGKPILEASDHGVIYLEDKLADRNIAPSISGLLIQEVAEPLFRTPLSLVRAALLAYRQKTGYSEELNEYLAPITSAWKELSSDQKLDKLESIVEEKFSFECVDKTKIHFDTVEHQVRITVRFEEGIDKKIQPSLMMKLEKCLKEHSGVNIDLVYVGMADANYKRKK